MFGLVPYNRRNHSVGRRTNDMVSFNDLFESFFNDSLFPSFFNNSSNMRVDIKDNGKEYVLEADLPGVNKEDINLELKDDVLLINVETNEQINEEKENYIRRERRNCSMCRSFQLNNVKQDGVNAKYENGILSIILPKQETQDTKSRRIDIG